MKTKLLKKLRKMACHQYAIQKESVIGTQIKFKDFIRLVVWNNSTNRYEPYDNKNYYCEIDDTYKSTIYKACDELRRKYILSTIGFMRIEKKRTVYKIIY